MNDAEKDYLLAQIVNAGSIYDSYIKPRNLGFFSKNPFKRFLQKLGLMKKEKLSAGEYLSLIYGNILHHAVHGNSLSSGEYLTVEHSRWEEALWLDRKSVSNEEKIPMEKTVNLTGEVYTLTSNGVCGLINRSKEMNRPDLKRDELLNRYRNKETKK